MSEHSATLKSIGLALAKATDLCSRVGETFNNYMQRMLVYEAIMFRMNKDLRPLMVRHSEVIGDLVPGAFCQYKDGIITQAECLTEYLYCVAKGYNQEDQEISKALTDSFIELEKRLRKIYNSDTGCLLKN